MHRLNLTICFMILCIHFLHGQEKRIANKTVNSLEFKIDSLIENNNIGQEKAFLIINKLDSTNALLNKYIEKQNLQIEVLEKKLINPDISIFWEFIYPILLSIIAAIIFWFAFSFYPERQRKNKIRIKLDLEIYQIYTNLFALFDIVLKKNNNSPSDYQKQIRGEKITRRDFEIGLQNKCLNESYFYYPELQSTLLPIGKSLFNYIQKIDRKIDRLFNFSMYLIPEEILLFEGIRNKMHTYDLENHDRNAVSVIGGMSFKPINPSLTYMTHNCTELYELYKQLQRIVFQNKFENRDIFISKVQYLYYSDQYEETIKTINKNLHKYSKDENFLNWYVFQSLYELKKLPEAYNLLESLFEKKAHLVSYRNQIKMYLADKEIQTLINKYYSDNNYSELKRVIEEEEFHERAFINNAKTLEEFYAKKVAENGKK